MNTPAGDFDYNLPESLIAQEAPAERTLSRLMVIDRLSGKILHKPNFSSLAGFLREGDVLVLNDTKVIPGRIRGVKEDTGAKIEFLLVKQLSSETWDVLIKPSRRVGEGTVVLFADNLKAVVREDRGGGGWSVKFLYSGDFLSILERIGSPPIPPYIKNTFEKQALSERYQTVYACNPGAAAAPTAGLHFTRQLIDRIAGMGVSIVPLTIHTGAGTFLPVKEEFIENHRMGSEYFIISKSSSEAINSRPPGARVFAVGTTSTRVLETVSDDKGMVSSGEGWTDIFIRPGYRFKSVQALITNFHPPRSTTLLLTAAFAGKELLLKSYEEAVAQKYRFFSFGDATLII